MFENRRVQSSGSAAFGMLELIYHTAVRNVTKTHRSALMALLMSMMQAVIFVGVFYVMFSILGLRGSALRGNFILFIMTGIFMFLTHTKAMQSTLGAEGAGSPMMKHAPMNTIISIVGSALAALYTQVLTVFVIFFVYYIAIEPIPIYQPLMAFYCLLLSWFTGIAVGLVFLAAKPWAPGLVSTVSSLYMRANMIASGKMFVANTLPTAMLTMFDWNPLFHAIDQSRGFAFINYSPRNSDIMYPLYFGLALIMVGLMLEFYTRKHASESWNATA